MADRKEDTPEAIARSYTRFLLSELKPRSFEEYEIRKNLSKAMSFLTQIKNRAKLRKPFLKEKRDLCFYHVILYFSPHHFLWP